MIVPVTSAYAELYHYTTGIGLEAIVRTQQLRATHIRYLNDADEFIGFFSRRLPRLLRKPVSDAVEELLKSASSAKIIQDSGGAAKAIEDMTNDMGRSLLNATIAFHEPFVTAFCSPPDNQPPNDGLLSQWRGYGVDGGYAIVFDTRGLEALLNQEVKNFHYQFGNWSDVDYDDQGSNLIPPHPERVEWESRLQEAILNFVATQKPDALENVYDLMAYLACRHKHQGFREEMEVRIVAIPTNDEVYKAAFAGGARQPRKPIYFAATRGMLVPHIFLFGAEVDGKMQKLPIIKVIVGPHPDWERRKKTVELLLKQHQIDAAVVASTIPYLGR